MVQVSAGSQVLFRLFLLLSLAGSVLNLVPPLNWLHEINANLGAYYLAVHVVSLFPGLLLLRAGALRKSLLAALLMTLALWYILAFLPFLQPPGRTAATGRFSVLYANVHVSGTDYAALLKVIERENPDVVALLEPDERWLAELGLSRRYLYRVEHPREDPFGLALYSRFPVKGPLVDNLGSGLPPLILQRLEVLPGREVTFGLVHAQPPIDSSAFWSNKYLLRRLATMLRHLPGNFVIAGDFNATPFSFLYRRFVRWTGLQNSGWGHGLYRSWNARNPLQRFTVDHIFHRGALGVLSFKRLEDVGSDHYPFLVEYAVTA